MILVYTSRSNPHPKFDGKRVIRMALHPIDCEPMGEGPKFPFRVAWRWDSEDIRLEHELARVKEALALTGWKIHDPVQK